MPDEENGDDGSMKRRNYLKGITATGVALGGLGGISTTSFAQEAGEIPAPFCGPASTPPEQPPGGQAGQCINCVSEACGDGSEPVAVGELYSGLNGFCFTVAADDIPDTADYLTLKAGEECYLAEVPDNLEGDVTFCKPEEAPEISNATFYTCGGENPPSVDDVAASCDEVVIETSNISNGETLDVTVEFADGSTETYEATVQNGEAIVDELPGDVNPVSVTVTYQDNQILFDAGVTADPPCPDEPAVTNVEVTCAQILIQTVNIDENETLDVTVTFTDNSTETYTPPVNASGIATVTLPGDRDPEQLLVEYDGQVLYDQFVEASDAPCTAPEPPECPPGLDIKFKCKHGKWKPYSHGNSGNVVDPDVFSIKGDLQEVTIYAPFPFAVGYATRTKGKKHHHHHDENGHHGKKKHHKGCKRQDVVLAESVDGQFCATVSTDGKKKEICWVRVFCPEDNGGNNGDGNHEDGNREGGNNGGGNDIDDGC
jgi:hypothetical protein